MEEADRDFIIGLIFITLVAFLFCAVIFFISWWTESVSCHAKWERTALAVEYGPFKGCLIETKDAGWIPAETYHNGVVQVNP